MNKTDLDRWIEKHRLYTFADLPEVDGLTLYDLTCERYREYDFGGRTYRINTPVGVYFRKGGTTHRVVDKKRVTHCVPAPGHCGCVLRWVDWDNHPCRF